MASPTTARRRSAVVAIPAVTFLAASVLTSCQVPGREKRACVDPNNRVIDQRQCTTPGGIGRYYYYRGGSYRGGQSIGGGSFTRGGSKSTSASKVGRGGFGGRSSSGG
ncbi:MAG: hypothetical protein ABIS47_13385 [Acidimicrobiales bacterium]